MKRFILSMAMMLTVAMSSMAMSYEQARDRALFLTDKMAYELNLNDEQYEAAYEVNLDYLMSINTYDDLYGTYWTRRNLDLSYILLDWQYSAFCSAAYFYRPLTWSAGVWRFGIYARYPSRTYFYFGRPTFYATYCGGHSWRMNGGRSWYHGRTFGPRPGESRFGMRDRFDRGDYRGTTNHGGGFDRRDNSNGRGNNGRNDRNNRGNFGGYRGTNSGSTASRSNGNTPSKSTEGQSSSQPNNKNNGGFSGSRTNNRWGNINVKTSDAMRQNRSINEMTRQSSTRETVTRTPQVRMERSSNSTPSRSTSGSSFSRPSSSMSNSSFSRPSTSVSRSSSTTMSRPATTFTPSRSSSNGGSGRASGGGQFGGRR